MKKLCQEKQIKYGEEEIIWYLQREEKQIFYSLKISENSYLVDNIKIKQYSKETIFLLDPEEQGIQLIKQLNWQQAQTPVNKISELSPSLRKEIESCILYGRIVIIEIDPT